MGTKTIKPRSNNDGQIGSSDKYWDKGFFNDLHVNNLHTSSSSTLSANGISVTSDSGIVFEGSSADEHELQLTATNPTVDRVILFPDASGTVALTSDITSGVTINGTTANGITTFASSGTLDVESTLTYDGTTLTHTPDAWSSTKNFFYLDLNDSASSSSRNAQIINIDYDKTFDTSGSGAGDTVSAKGLIINLNDAATGNAGTTVLYGIQNTNTFANANGTSAMYGFVNTLLGGDEQNGIRNVCIGATAATTTGFYQNVEDGGTDLMFVSSADTGDYFSISTTTHGATTITTVDDDNSGNSASANLTLNIDGDIILNSETGAGANGGIRFQQVGTEFVSFTRHHGGTYLQLFGNGGTSTGDFFTIDVADHGDTTLTTEDAAGAQGHFRIVSDGDIILNSGSGNIQIQDTAAEKVSFGQHIHKQVKVNLDTTDCNNLHSTPIELIPAQGANTIIVPQSGVMMVDNNTSINQTNSAADLNFHYEDKEPGAYQTTSLFHIRRFMNTNHSTDIVYSLGEMSGFEISQNLTDCVNKAVEVSVDSALNSNSITAISIYLSYHVIDLT